MDWHLASDIKSRLITILRATSLNHVKPARVFAFKSFGSKANAYARIWALPTIWQKALDIPAAYCIEVIWEKFQSLSYEKQTKVLIHELLHIPKTFSGSLVQHKGKGKYGVCHQNVEKIYKEYRKNNLRAEKTNDTENKTRSIFNIF